MVSRKTFQRNTSGKWQYSAIILTLKRVGVQLSSRTEHKPSMSKALDSIPNTKIYFVCKMGQV
jgi:hypothetical protein